MRVSDTHLACMLLISCRGRKAVLGDFAGGTTSLRRKRHYFVNAEGSDCVSLLYALAFGFLISYTWLYRYRAVRRRHTVVRMYQDGRMIETDDGSKATTKSVLPVPATSTNVPQGKVDLALRRRRETVAARRGGGAA